MLQHGFLHAKMCRIFMLSAFVFVQLPLQASDNKWSWKQWTILATGVAGFFVSAWYLKSYLVKSKKGQDGSKKNAEPSSMVLEPFSSVSVGPHIKAVINQGDRNFLKDIGDCQGTSGVDVQVQDGLLSLTRTNPKNVEVEIHTTTPIKRISVQQDAIAVLRHPDTTELTIEHQGVGAKTRVDLFSNIEKVKLISPYPKCSARFSSNCLRINHLDITGPTAKKDELSVVMYKTSEGNLYEKGCFALEVME